MSENNFEMADGDNPEDIIHATQRSVLAAMQQVIDELKKDVDSHGLTWDQIQFFLDGFKNKKPVIFLQENEQ